MTHQTGVPALVAASVGTTHAAIRQWIADGMPTDSLDSALAWARVNRPKHFSNPLDETLEAAKVTDKGPRGAYARARDLEQEAYEAAKADPSSQAILAHSKAAASAASMAEAVAEWERKAGNVIDVETQKADWIRLFSALRAELDGMPVRVGEKLGPAAEPVLSQWKDRLLTRLERIAPFGDLEPEELEGLE